MKTGGIPLQEIAEGNTDKKKTYYKEIQLLFKRIAERAVLEKEFRQLCLKDSKAAIKEISGDSAVSIENILFLEEEQKELEEGKIPYILPPFLKKTWYQTK